MCATVVTLVYLFEAEADLGAGLYVAHDPRPDDRIDSLVH